MKPASHPMFQGISRHVAAGVLAAAAACGLAPAQAALPFGTLSYVQPSGVVAPDEVVDVRVVFTLDAASPALSFSSDPLVGFAVEDLPVEGAYYNPDSGQYEQRPFASYTGAYLSTFFTCTGTFTDVCGPSASYSFEFWLSSTPGNPSINFLDAFTLAPGASTEYLFGQFVPAAGGALPGSYLWHNTGLTLSVRGLDADGNHLEAFDFHTLAQSCPSLDDACAFTRTVLAVPEPATWATLVLGLLGIGSWATRHRRR